MIILSGALVVVAIALLVAGIVAGNGESAQVLGLDALVVIYISIAVSVVSALCLAIGVFLRRKELFGTGASAASARKGGRKGKTKSRKKAERPAPAAGRAKGTAPAGKPEADDEVEIPPPPAGVPDDAVVFVVRGRKRYHLDTCRQLAGRDRDELTYAEAKEEGFSPCTACMPDTALAARAAVSVTAGSGKKPGAPGKATAGSEQSTTAELPQGPMAAPVDPPTTPLTKPARPGPVPSTPVPSTPVPSTPVPSTPAPSTPAPGATAEPGLSTSGPAGPRPSVPDAAGSGPAPASEPVVQAPGPIDATPPPGFRSDPLDAGPPFSGHGGQPSSPSPPSSGSGSRFGSGLGSETERGEPEAGSGSAAAPVPSAWPVPGAAKPPETDTEPVPSASSVPSAPSVPAQGDESREPGDAPRASGEPAGSGGDGDGGVLVRILGGTKRYHHVDCALIEDIGDEADDLETLTRGEAKTRGCTPCLVCQPDREHARD